MSTDSRKEKGPANQHCWAVYEAHRLIPTGEVTFHIALKNSSWQGKDISGSAGVGGALPNRVQGCLSLRFLHPWAGKDICGWKSWGIKHVLHRARRWDSFHAPFQVLFALLPISATAAGTSFPPVSRQSLAMCHLASVPGPPWYWGLGCFWGLLSPHTAVKNWENWALGSNPQAKGNGGPQTDAPCFIAGTDGSQTRFLEGPKDGAAISHSRGQLANTFWLALPSALCHFSFPHSSGSCP